MKHNHSMPTRARHTLGVLALALLGAAACDDPSLFTPTDTVPEITAFSISPDRLAEGETLQLEVSASGPRLIEAFRFTFSGALQRDTVVNVPTPRGQVSAQLAFTVPGATGPDSLASVTVVAIDASTGTSAAAAPEPFVILDATPPVVTATTTTTSVAGGHNFQVTVRGTDNRGVAVLGVIRDFEGQQDTVAADTVAAANALRDRQRTFTVAAPLASSSAFTVRGFATDIAGFSTLSATSTVELTDGIGPDITMQTNKDTYPLGDSVLVTTQLVDPAGIQSVTFVGISIRGSPEFGEDEFFVRFPARTVTYPRTQADTLFKVLDLKHWLFTPDHTTAETVDIIVVATDGLGNVSEATQTISVGGPDVEMLFPSDDPSFVRTWTIEKPSELQVRVRVKDTRPISHAFVLLEGDLNDSIPILPGFTPTDTIRTVTITMPAEEGAFTVLAGAINDLGISGRTRPLLVVVSEEATLPIDTIPPVASLRFSTRGTPVGSFTRLEFTDTLTFHVTASDVQSGLVRMGVWAILERRAGGVDTVRHERVFTTPSTNQEELELSIPLDSLYAIMGFNSGSFPDVPGALDAITPDTVRLQIFAFAADSAHVSCAVGLSEQKMCNTVADSANALFRPVEGGPMQAELIAVRGRTVRLAQPGSVIADLAVDNVDERVYLSNITRNIVEPLQLDSDPTQITFLDPVLVGSQPWGLFIGTRIVGPDEGPGTPPEGQPARTLIVANSGGTNMSMVNLNADPAFIREVAVVRVHTPNSVIYQVRESQDNVGNTKFTGEWFDFSDRPQFVAQDSLLRLVYSTVPTGAANTATVRFGVTDPDPTAAGDTVEVRLLITLDMVSTESEDYVVANVDDLVIRAFAGQSDEVQLVTHEPGYPGRKLFSGFHVQFEDASQSLVDQLDAVMLARGVPEQAGLYYPFVMRGSWDMDRVGMSDTTFISASADGGRIVIGEGAAAPTGRIVLWHADPCDPVTLTCATLSSGVEVLDLISNASERVLGVGLNQDGSLGAARGLEATYFFTPDLRLQGLFQQAEQGGAGAAFHPDHSSVSDGSHLTPDGRGAAFTGTSNRSVEVVNTFHFNLITTLGIRDNIVGPLRTGPRLATDPADIAVKVYGITDVGGVVIINVRTSDLEP